MDGIPEGLSALLDAVHARDAAGAAHNLAEYVIFESPIVAQPFVGRDQVSNVVSALLDIFDEFTVTEIIAGEGCFAVVVNIKIGMTELDAVDLIGINAEGKVASISIHVRPLPAIVALQNRLAPVLGVPVLTLAEEQ